jgi:hypothetical protein
MKTLKIYDPAMCCSTGVCGPDVDPVLVQLTGFLKNLDASAVKVERYNLSQEPAAYTTGTIATVLKEKGTDALPLVILDDKIISSGEYPDLEKLSGLLDATSAPVSMEMPDCSGCSGCG